MPPILTLVGGGVNTSDTLGCFVAVEGHTSGCMGEVVTSNTVLESIISTLFVWG